MKLLMFSLILIPFSRGSSVAIKPASITFPKASAPFSVNTSTKVALPAKGPITPQLPKAISALEGILRLHLWQFSLLPNPCASNSPIAIPFSPSAVSIMSFPLEISSLTTSLGSNSYTSLIMFIVGTGEKVPPQFTPIIITLSSMIFPFFINSLMVIASQGLHATASFIYLAPSKYLDTNLAMFKVPQCTEPAVLITSAGSVTRIGTPSYISWPSVTPTTPSTMPSSNKYFMIVVTTPPYSPFSLISSIAEYA